MNNKFPHHILFPEKLPTYFEITASPTVYRSVTFHFVYIGRRARIHTELEKFETFY